MAVRRNDREKRQTEAFVAELEKIPKQQRASRRRKLTEALERTPELMLAPEIQRWLQFGDLVSAVQRLEIQQLPEAGIVVSDWLRLNDARLNPGAATDVKAPLHRLRTDLHPHLSLDAMALLDWPTFRQSMRGKDLSSWANHLKRRVAHGQPVDAADVPISVLRSRPDVAADIGPLALARVGVANLDDPSLREDGAATLSRAWGGLNQADRAAVDILTAALEGVSTDVLLEVDLPAALRVIGLWSVIKAQTEEVWPHLDHEARVLAIYRAAAEQLPLELSILDEAHGLALTAELIFTAQRGERDVVKQADTAASRVVIDHGWVDTDPPSLESLLPMCALPADSGVRYCEGKLWNSSVWCPRLRSTCDSAHITPERQRPWWRWTLLELMESRGVTWRHNQSTSWPNDLAGWLNRWHDIRERLRCSTCWTVMQPDYRYSRSSTAAYGKTVMNCPTGEPGHDRGVYLNHCNGCHDPIDSRECQHRIDGFYLCMRCGSGPDGLTPGTVCAACTSTKTTRPKTSRWATCQDCGHRMHTPE